MTARNKFVGSKEKSDAMESKSKLSFVIVCKEVRVESIKDAFDRKSTHYCFSKYNEQKNCKETSIAITKLKIKSFGKTAVFLFLIQYYSVIIS